MKLSPSLVWHQVLQAIKTVLTSIDHGLVAFASLFGTSVHSRTHRALTLLGIYASLYALSFIPIPAVAIISLVLAYLGVVAIGRAWVANEKHRTRIVKKIDNEDPDQLPDLRFTACLAALQLLIIFPLLFMVLQSDPETRLFSEVPDVANGLWWQRFSAWSVFNLASLSRTLVGLFGGDDLVSRFKDETKLGNALVILQRTTIDLLLFQAVLRLFAIWSNVQEGVAALKQDPDIARRVGRRATLSLIDALYVYDAELRKRAAEVLGHLKDKRAVPALLRALGDAEPEVREKAAWALGHIGHPESVQPLVNALHDPAEGVRREALHALGRMSSVAARGPLMNLVRSNEPAPVRAAAIEALAERGERDALPALIDALRESGEDVQVAAAMGLGTLKDPRGVGPLADLLAGGTAPANVRKEAVRSLEGLGDEKVVPILLRVVQDPDPFVRKFALRALGKLGDEMVVPALIEALRDAVPEVKEAAARALGLRKDPRAVEGLLPLLEDPNEIVRDAAAEALAAINSRETVPALLGVLREGVPAARALAADLLGKLGDARGVPALILALRDEDIGTREMAAWALGQVGGEEAVAPLEQAAQDQEESVRERAKSALQTVRNRRTEVGAGTAG